MDDMFQLNGKTAIVWGGGQGMGEMSALRLARAGCDVALVDLVGERAQSVADKIQKLGRRATALVADVTIEDDVIKAVAEAEAKLGPIDRMVSVVGASGWVPLVDMSLEEWHKGHALNLLSFFLTARTVARAMQRGKRSGAIVGIASVSGLTSAPHHASYGAAKAGLVNLVRSMAVEWAPDIRVNAIAPGPISTARVQGTDERMAVMRRRLPLQRMGTTDEIGKAALFLSSDLASFVTGQTLAVDGGWMSAWLLDTTSEAAPPKSA